MSAFPLFCLVYEVLLAEFATKMPNFHYINKESAIYLCNNVISRDSVFLY